MEEKVWLKMIMQKEQIKEEMEVDLAEMYNPSLDVGWSLGPKHLFNSEPLLNRLKQLRSTTTLILICMESQWKASVQLRTSIKSTHVTRFYHFGGGTSMRVKWSSRIVVASKKFEYHHHFKAIATSKGLT